VELSICEGDTYMFGNRELRVPGEYTGSFIGSGGCDSIVFLTLEIIPRRSSGFSVSICEGETYEFNDQVLDQSGIYQQTLMGSNGCDSIITLNLNVIPTSRTNIIQTICAGETYVFGNRTIRETGVYQDTFQAQNGCDIIFSLDLTVLPIFTDTLVETICAGQTFSVGNQNYTQTGIFTQTLTSIEGCDSTVVLDLTVTEAFVDTFNISVCQGDTFMLGTQALTSPGTYIAFLESLEGCDSTVTVNLDFQNPIDTAVSLTICSGETYFFGNRQLRFPGTYLNTFSTVNGCDSTVTLEFSIEDIDTTITIDSTGIFANAPEGTYQWIDCATDSIVLETDTALFLPPSSGEYKLVIITEFCSDTTNCFSLISTSTEEQLLNSDDFNVYPNPALNNLTIETDPSLMGIYQMKIMDFTGRVYQTNNIQLLPREEIEVNDLPAGMYLIHLFNRDIGSVRLRFLKIE
ncbi:MAG: T9SS type A sorting domain-containing protein, partial [Bacteroidota bacterium]